MTIWELPHAPTSSALKVALLSATCDGGDPVYVLLASVFASGRVRPQRTAFLTSSAIFFSSAGVNSSSAKEVGHILPSSRFAAS
jgi:hypothetical protein